MISRFPDDKLTVIVFANLINANEKKLAHGVAAIYNSALAAPVAKTIEDKEPKVTAFVKDFLQKTAAGQVSQEMFTTEAAAALFPDRIKQAGENLKSLGIFADIQLMERTEKDDKRIYRYRVNYRNFQDNFLMVTIGLTKDDKIAGVQLRPE